MAAEVPWHSDSPAFDAREAAREAARRAGLTLGAWVEQAIEERARRAGLDADDLPEDDKIDAIAGRLAAMASQDSDALQNGRRANVSAFAAPARGKHARLLEAAARRMETRNPGVERVDRHIAEIETALVRRAPARHAPDSADPLAPFESRLMRIAESLRAQAAFDPHDSIAALRKQVEELTRAIAVLGKRSEAQIAPALRALLLRVESEKQKGHADQLAPVLGALAAIQDELARSPLRALQDEIAAINARLDRPSVDAEAIETLQRDARNIARSLAIVAARMPSQEKIEAQIAALAERVEEIARMPRELASHIVDLAQELRQAIEQADPSRALRAMERRIEALAFQGSQGPQAMAAALQEMRASVDALVAHPALKELPDQIGALTARSDELPQFLVDALADLQKSVARAVDRSCIDKLEERIAELGARVSMPSHIPETLAELRLSIERLAAQTGMRAPDEALAAVPAKLDALDEKVTAIHRRVDEAATSSVLLSRLDKLQSVVLTRLDDMQRTLAKTPAAAPAFRTEDVVNQLALRLERAGQMQASDPRALQALENQILRIAERLDRNGETTEAIAALERSMSELFAQIEETRARPAPPAADAAPALAEIAREFRALHGEADGRTQATLHALQETLEKVVDRLALVEGDLGHLRGKAAPAAPAPAREPEILIEPGEPFTPPHATRLDASRQEMAVELSEPRAAQRSFIAAARRASQMFAHASRRETLETSEESEAQGASAALARAGGDKARTAMLGLTGLVMLLGAFQIARAPGETATDVAQDVPASTPPAALAALLDPTPTGSIAARRTSDLLVLAELADGGNPAAQYELGARLADGRDTQRDSSKAAYWFQKAAEQNYAPAQYRLGSIYEKGQGAARSPRNAALWYGRAAEAGHVRAMHNLGVLLADGLDGKPDYAAAAAMFRKAAEHGLRDSQYNLALLYMRGLGVEANLAEAYKFFSLAAAQGDGEAAIKRADVEQRLPVKQLSEARAAAETFRLQKPDPIANEPASLETIVNAPRASDTGARQKLADRVILSGP